MSLDVEIVYKDDNHFEIVGYFLFLKRTFILTRIDDEERKVLKWIFTTF